MIYQGPSGQQYRFPEGTSEEAALNYIRQQELPQQDPTISERFVGAGREFLSKTALGTGTILDRAGLDNAAEMYYGISDQLGQDNPQPDIDALEIDSFGKLGTFIRDQLIHSAPYSVGPITGGALTGATFGGPIGALGGAIAGGILGNTLAFTGEAIEEQEQQLGVSPEEADLSSAFGAGVTMAGLESVVDAFLVGRVASLTIPKGFTAQTVTDTLKKILTTTGVSAGAGATTELAQEATLIYQANPQLLSELNPETFNRLASSAIGGAIVDGVLGGSTETAVQTLRRLQRSPTNNQDHTPHTEFKPAEPTKSFEQTAQSADLLGYANKLRIETETPRTYTQLQQLSQENKALLPDLMVRGVVDETDLNSALTEGVDRKSLQDIVTAAPKLQTPYTLVARPGKDVEAVVVDQNAADTINYLRAQFQDVEFITADQLSTWKPARRSNKPELFSGGFKTETGEVYTLEGNSGSRFEPNTRKVTKPQPTFFVDAGDAVRINEHMQTEGAAIGRIDGKYVLVNRRPNGKWSTTKENKAAPLRFLASPELATYPVSLDYGRKKHAAIPHVGNPVAELVQDTRFDPTSTMKGIYSPTKKISFADAEKLIKQLAPRVRSIPYQQSKDRPLGTQAWNLIQLATNLQKGVRTTNLDTTLHEIVHALDKGGYFTDEEFAALEAQEGLLRENARASFMRGGGLSPSGFEEIKQRMLKGEENLDGIRKYWLELIAQGLENVLYNKYVAKQDQDISAIAPLYRFANDFEKLVREVKAKFTGPDLDLIAERILRGDVGNRTPQLGANNTFLTKTKPVISKVDAQRHVDSVMQTAWAPNIHYARKLAKVFQNAVTDPQGNPRVLLRLDKAKNGHADLTHTPQQLFDGPLYFENLDRLDLKIEDFDAAKFSGWVDKPEGYSWTEQDILETTELRNSFTNNYTIMATPTALKTLQPYDATTNYLPAEKSFGYSRLQDAINAQDRGAVEKISQDLQKQGYDALKFEYNGGEVWYSFKDEGVGLSDTVPVIESFSEAHTPQHNDGKQIYKGTRLPRWLKDSSRFMLTPRMLAALDPEFAKVFAAVQRLTLDRTNTIVQATQLWYRYGHLNDKTNVHAALEIGRHEGKHPKANEDGTASIVNARKNLQGSRRGETITLSSEEFAAYKSHQAGTRFILNEWKKAIISNAGIFFYPDPKNPRKFLEGKLDENSSARQIARTLTAYESRIKWAEEHNLDGVVETLQVSRNKMNELFEGVRHLENAMRNPYFPAQRFGEISLTVKGKKVSADAEEQILHYETLEDVKFPMFGNARHKKTAERSKKLKEIYEAQGFFDVRVSPAVPQKDLLVAETNSNLPNLERLIALLSPDDRDGFIKGFNKLTDAMTAKGAKKYLKNADLVPGYSMDFDRTSYNYLMTMAAAISHVKHQGEMQSAVNRMDVDATKPNVGIAATKLKQHAQDYVDWIKNPENDYNFLRQLTFFQTLGGQFSSAVMNIFSIPHFAWPVFQSVAPKSKVKRHMTTALLDAGKLIGAFEKQAAADAQNLGTSKPRAWFQALTGFALNFDDPKVTKFLRSDLEKEYIKRAAHEGFLRPMQLPEAIGLTNKAEKQLQGKVRKGFTTALEASAIMFQATEAVSRITVFLATIRMLEAKPELMERFDRHFASQNELYNVQVPEGPDKVFHLAKFMVEDTVGVFNRENRPFFMRDGIPSYIGHFQSYPQQMMELQLKLWRKSGTGTDKEFKTAARNAAIMMGAGMILFGGLFGNFAFRSLSDVVDFLATLFTKPILGKEVHIEKSIEDFVENLTGSDAIANMVRNGVASEILGVDVKDRMSLSELPFIDALMNFAQPQQNPFAVLGAPGSALFQPFVGAYNDLGNGRTALEAAANFLPPAFKAAYQAERWETEGLLTSTNKRLAAPPGFGNENLQELTAFDLWAKRLGFTSNKISKLRQEYYETGKIGDQGAYNNQVERRKLVRLLTKLADGNMNGLAGQAEEARIEIDEFMDRLRNHNEQFPNDPIILDMSSIKEQVKRNVNYKYRLLRESRKTNRKKVLEELE